MPDGPFEENEWTDLLGRFNILGIDSNEAVAAYIESDSPVLTTGELSEADIINEIQQAKEIRTEPEVRTESDSDEDVPPPIPPSKADALDALEVVSRYLDSQTAPADMHSKILTLQTYISSSAKPKQSSITNFFTSLPH